MHVIPNPLTASQRTCAFMAGEESLMHHSMHITIGPPILCGAGQNDRDSSRANHAFACPGSAGAIGMTAIG